VLAAQLPRNFDAPSHTLIGAVATQGPWKEHLAPLLRRPPVEPPQFYFDLLEPLAERLDLWETRYVQVLEGENPVAEFTKGSWLKPLLDALQEPLRGEFEAEYRRRVLTAYPPRANGTTLFPFKRLFVVATKVG
jgi:trans-aconitate 2-methyltransferase